MPENRFSEDIQPVSSLIDNYIYLYHLDTFVIIPSFVADSIQDNMAANFVSTPLLSRSAPIFSYTGSGPRSMNMSFELHRDMMYQLNKDLSNAKVDLGIGYDYVDYIIKNIQAMALPTYDAASKMVNPPLVAVRLGSDIFIKGVVNGPVNVEYSYPIIEDAVNKNGRYGTVKVGFSVAEVDPYDAYQVAEYGSFRGFDGNMEGRFLNIGGNF